MITDKEILDIAKNNSAYSVDGKEFRFYHGCELLTFAREMYALGMKDTQFCETDVPNA